MNILSKMDLKDLVAISETRKVPDNLRIEGVNISLIEEAKNLRRELEIYSAKTKKLEEYFKAIEGNSQELSKEEKEEYKEKTMEMKELSKHLKEAEESWDSFCKKDIKPDKEWIVKELGLLSILLENASGEDEELLKELGFPSLYKSPEVLAYLSKEVGILKEQLKRI